MVKKRQFTREFKLSILKELEIKKMSEVCREHNLAFSTVSGWKNDYNGNPKSAFNGHGNLWKENAKIAKYERLVGQLYAENDFLKKVLEKLKQTLVEERNVKRCYTE